MKAFVWPMRWGLSPADGRALGTAGVQTTLVPVARPQAGVLSRGHTPCLPSQPPTRDCPRLCMSGVVSNPEVTLSP